MYRYIKMANKYHQKIKEKLCKEARERYQNLFQEEKEKTQKKTQDRYENLSEDEKEKSISIIVIKIKIFLKKKKQKKVEYTKNYYLGETKIFQDSIK